MWESESFETTANGIEKDVTGGIEGQVGIDLEVVDVGGNIFDFGITFRIVSKPVGAAGLVLGGKRTILASRAVKERKKP